MRGLGDKISHFLPGFYVRERKRKRKRKRSPRLLSTIHEVPSVGIRLDKNVVHRLDEGYACVPKMRDFTKDLKKEI